MATAANYKTDKKHAPLDLVLRLAAANGAPGLVLEYRSDLFSSKSAARLVSQIRRMLEAFASKHAKTREKTVVEDVALDAPEDVVSTLVKPNETKQTWPEDQCVHDLMLAAAKTHKHRPCLKYDLDLEETSYAHFGAAVAAISVALQGFGMGPDKTVALLLERDPAMVAAVYGVLASGACYVPLEPDYPLDRLRTVVEDANCGVAITQKHLRTGQLAAFLDTERPPCLRDVLELGEGGFDPFMNPTLPDGGAKCRNPSTKPNHLVYVFYTSGTTGKPKGVMVEHRGLARRIAWFQRRYPLGVGDAMVLKTTYTSPRPRGVFAIL